MVTAEVTSSPRTSASMMLLMARYSAVLRPRTSVFHRLLYRRDFFRLEIRPDLPEPRHRLSLGGYVNMRLHSMHETSAPCRLPPAWQFARQSQFPDWY